MDLNKTEKKHERLTLNSKFLFLMQSILFRIWHHQLIKVDRSRGHRKSKHHDRFINCIVCLTRELHIFFIQSRPSP